MQGNDDAVFKVPTPKLQKKKRMNLYCYETVEDLDESWNSTRTPTSSNSSTSVAQTSPSVQKRKAIGKSGMDTRISSPYVQLNEPTGDPMLNDSNESIAMASLLTHHDTSDDDMFFHFQKPDSSNKYSNGLLSELTKQNRPTTVNNDDMDWTVPDIDWPQKNEDNMDCNIEHFQQLKSHTMKNMNVVNPDEDSLYSQDILLVRDESMANIDWDSSSGSDSDGEARSLTPPVPGSPSDHTVPDMDHGNSPGREMNYCDYDDYLVPQMHRTNRSTSLTVRRSDHTVPNMFL